MTSHKIKITKAFTYIRSCLNIIKHNNLKVNPNTDVTIPKPYYNLNTLTNLTRKPI